MVVKLAQSVRRLLWVREAASLSPVSTNALVKIECAWNSLDKEPTADCLVETRKKLKELILAAMVKYGLNRVQLPLWLQHVPD